MSNLDHWKGISARPRIVLVELPGLQIVMDGHPLNPLLLHYPKYPQLILAANIASCIDNTLPVFVGLKGSSRSSDKLEKATYRAMLYEGRRLEFQRIGLPLVTLEDQVGDADIIGISCNYSMERALAVELIGLLRRWAPRALIVIGGHDATVVPLPYLTAGAHLCVLGEGETALCEIIAAKSSAELMSLRGIAYLEEGALRRNGRRRTHALDRILYPSPQMLSEQGYEQYPDGPWPVGVGPSYAVLETSRGCDEACNFCSSTFVSGRFRSWSIDGIFQQLERVKSAGIRTLLISDDNVLYRLTGRYGGAAGRAELILLFKTMCEEGFAWTFYNGIQFGLLERQNNIDEELIGALFWNRYRNGLYCGCFEAYIPLERFSFDDMQQLPKLRDPETQRRIISAIATQRVHRLNLGFIVGTPSDSRSELESAAHSALSFGDLILSASSNSSQVLYLPWCSVPLPGTPNRRSYWPYINYDLDIYPELHSNYISVVEGIDMRPGEFTEARRSLDEHLNDSSRRHEWFCAPDVHHSSVEADDLRTL